MPSLLLCLLQLCLAAASPGLRLRLWNNSARAGPALRESLLPSPDFALPASWPFSAELSGTLSFPSAGVYSFNCSFKGIALAFVWVDGHLVCQQGLPYDVPPEMSDNPLPVQGMDAGSAAKALPLRAHAMGGGEAASVSVQWARWERRQPRAPEPIPTSLLSSALPPCEEERERLQRELATGWGLWLHQSILAVVSLPSAATMTLSVCKSGSSKGCIDNAQADGHKQNARSASVRVGHHAYDRSYVQYYLGHSSADALPESFNASVEISNGGEDLNMLVTPLAGFENVELVLDFRFAWLRQGSVQVTTASAEMLPAGMRAIKLHSTAAGTVANTSQMRIPLDKGPVGFSTKQRPATEIAELLNKAKEEEEKLLLSDFGETFAGRGMAVKASVMWNLVFSPAENGAAMLPVSRAWDSPGTQGGNDFSYVIFDWDNIFASLLAGVGSREIAYSNLIQVMKSKTAAGFIPNFSANGRKTQDRGEPPVGARALLQLFEKYGDRWLLELLFDDLLDWSSWFAAKRLLPPLGLVALGSRNEQAEILNRSADLNMQTARWESGLDNSPMYDGEFFDGEGSFLMQLYDVGMSSMFAMEAYALAKLAKAIGRPEAAMLKVRGDAMAALIRSYLWDEGERAFVNKFTNGSFYRRVSPTSFYPLMAGAASDEQAEVLVREWLLSPDRFCIAAKGDFAGNRDDCYWGLPSIQASDPAYPPLGYWRGYVWGPMAQLVYWSLLEYDHVPAARAGRKALVKQMGAMMMEQWDLNRHICENYNPHKTADTSGGDCSGTKFYHWGGLTGLVELVEEGFWSGKGELPQQVDLYA